MKKSKKFVLAALALLAITGLLALAGCKNDSVPEPTRYTVKFETDHGTAPDDITVVSGTKLTDKDLAIEPEAGDNIFEYWYDKDDDAQKPVEEGYTVTKDVTLVAKWRDRGTVASVTFSPAGDTKFYCDESIAVSLTSEEGATIQYHLGDGSWKDYNADSQIPITGDTTITTITARAAKDGLKPSAVTSATYTVRKLKGITVTPPARTVYSVGEEVVHKKDDEIRVTATYDDGTTRTVTGTITTDTRTLTQSAGVQTVTVRYSEGGIGVSGQFEIKVLPKELTDYKSPNNTDGSWTYVEFGEWPQTIKADSVTVDESEGKGKQMGMFTYYLGDDDNYYVKHSDKYYKVEPIVWRVLTEDYKDPDGKSTGNALLLAEKILTGGIDWDANVVVGGVTQSVADNYYIRSNIRRWLNGNTEPKGDSSDYKGTPGFLQTAFTTDAQGKIAPTIVNNTADSTTPTNGGFTHSPFIGGNTTDKIFLLSMREATTAIYGFAESFDNSDSARSRVPTDYAKATGATGGWWWLRSSFYESSLTVRTIHSPGNSLYRHIRNDTDGGFVPALCIPADQLPLP